MTSNSSNDSESDISTGSPVQTKLWVLGIMIGLTLIGNSLVIFAIVIRQIKMSRMYFFILHLSIADVLTAFLTLFPELIWTHTSPNFYGGSLVCKAVKFGQMIGPYLSSYVLIMTAIDRYHAICFPLSKCTWTPRRSNIMIGLAWLISLCLCIPQSIIFGSGSRDYSCSAYFVGNWGQRAYVAWFAVSNFFLPLVILIYCYSCICKTIWDNFNSKIPLEKNGKNTCSLRRIIGCRSGRQEETEEIVAVRYRWKSTKTSGGPLSEYSNQEVEAEDTTIKNVKVNFKLKERAPTRGGIQESASSFCNNSQTARGKTRFTSGLPNSPNSLKKKSSLNPRSHSIQGISRAKIKTVKLTVVVIAGYIICSAPFICVQLWVAFGTVTESIHSSITWLFWLVTLNSVVNPWIYMFFNTNLIEVFCRKSFFGCRSCCCHRRHREIPFKPDKFNFRNSQNSST